MRAQLCVAVLIGAAAATLLSACGSPTASEPIGDAELARVMDLRESQLRDLAVTLGLDEPTEIPALVRWVTLEESADAQVECLTEAGFPAESLGGSGIGFDRIPDEQKMLGGPLHAAMWECQALYSVDPRTQVALTKEQYRILLAYLDTTMRTCLTDRGYEFSEAPSLESFIEGYESGHPWVPWEDLDLANVPEDEYAELERECPQAPPSSELYGAPLPQP
jgi:hypothetical protein